jgi:hypothetical protein
MATPYRLSANLTMTRLLAIWQFALTVNILYAIFDLVAKNKATQLTSP